jgi:membrane-associated phospholipid phosphatase
MKKFVISSSVTAAALLAIAAFFDLRIEEYIYNPHSAFAKFFAAAGMLPQTVVLLLSPPMLLAALFERRSRMKSAAGIAAAAAILLATVCSIQGAMGGIHASAAVLIPVICVIMVAVFFAALLFAKKNRDGLFVAALAGFLAVTAGNAILQFLKTFWGRQRFYKMDDPAAQFTAWYLPQGRGEQDEFKSFPSGHSFSAMCAVWLALWPRFIDGLKQYTRLILALALVFGLAVMASRMIYGRHFLSDVTVGAAISLACFAAATGIAERLIKTAQTKTTNIRRH